MVVAAAMMATTPAFAEKRKAPDPAPYQQITTNGFRFDVGSDILDMAPPHDSDMPYAVDMSCDFDKETWDKRPDGACMVVMHFKF